MNWGVMFSVLAGFCWVLMIACSSIAKGERERGDIVEADKTRKSCGGFFLWAIIFTALAAGLLS